MKKQNKNKTKTKTNGTTINVLLNSFHLNGYYSRILLDCKIVKFLSWSYECVWSLNERSRASVNTEIHAFSASRLCERAAKKTRLFGNLGFYPD